jgi:TPR repeat protein
MGRRQRPDIAMSRPIVNASAAVAVLLGCALPAAASVSDLQAKAEGGEARAQMSLGLAFYRGDEAPADMQRAVTWFRKAADQGYAPAEAMLASLYAEGAGVPFDSRQSINWLRRAAVHGLPQAQVALGKAHDDGKDVARDPREAARWFQAAAAQGDAEGQRLLGEAYLQGKGVAQDAGKAVELLRTAAEKGDAGAEDDLGRLYEDGAMLPPNLVEARKWFVLAASNCKTWRVCDAAARNGLRVKAKMSVIEIEAADKVVQAWSVKPAQPAG